MTNNLRERGLRQPEQPACYWSQAVWGKVVRQGEGAAHMGNDTNGRQRDNMPPWFGWVVCAVSALMVLGGFLWIA